MAKSVIDINFIVDIFLIGNDHLYIEELLVMAQYCADCQKK